MLLALLSGTVAAVVGRAGVMLSDVSDLLAYISQMLTDIVQHNTGGYGIC